MNCLKNDSIKVYEGESGRSARVRGNEHVRDLENKKEKSALYKHMKNVHQNEKVKFRMEITSKFKDALTRQANEFGLKRTRNFTPRVWHSPAN